MGTAGAEVGKGCLWSRGEGMRGRGKKAPGDSRGSWITIVEGLRSVGQLLLVDRRGRCDDFLAKCLVLKLTGEVGGRCLEA